MTLPFLGRNPQRRQGRWEEQDDHAEGKRLHPSEIGWQSYLVKVIIHYCIVNKPTKAVIFEVLRNSTCTRVGDLGYTKFTMLDNGFHALLGSVLGTSNMRMLIDRKSKIGYRTVEKVVILSYRKEEPKDEYEKSRTMMIVLSEPRQTSTKLSRPDQNYRFFASRLCRSRNCPR